MAIKMKNGTPIHGPSLCDTCTNAHIEKGYRASEKVVVCTAHEPAHPVQFSIRECTDYRDRTRQSLWEMEKIAWTLSPQGSKRKAGFTAPVPVGKGDNEIELILNRDQ
jgi:hypothetical protein